MISNNPQATRLNDLNDATDTIILNEQKRYFEYLKTNVATNSMVTEAIGILQKNLTRYKRTFEDAGLLYELYKGICKKTKRRATYLTTNPDLIPKSNQLKMF
jgi:hypothetical protein